MTNVELFMITETGRVRANRYFTHLQEANKSARFLARITKSPVEVYSLHVPWTKDFLCACLNGGPELHAEVHLLHLCVQPKVR